MKKTIAKTKTRKMIDDILEMMTQEEVESLRKIMAAMIMNRRSIPDNRLEENNK